RSINMTVDKKLVKEFISITGNDESTANHLLEACSNNLELAVSNFLDENSAKHSTENGVSSESKDNVRAPIPQTRGVLVEEAPTATWNAAPRRRQHSVFDGFRNFKAEEGSTDRKVKRLEDLFRPPLDIMHRGSFESAREEGRKMKKWLLVNIQNAKEFSCQVLNRDVWSVPTVKSLLKENFIFWQVYSDSSEGERFMTFYSIESWPHVSILDPRTGGRMGTLSDITKDSVISEVTTFLEDHGTLDPDEPPAKKSKRDILDASEDSQLAAAIAASLRENLSKKTSDSESDFPPASSSSEDEVREPKPQPSRKVEPEEAKPTRKRLVKIFPKRKKKISSDNCSETIGNGTNNSSNNTPLCSSPPTPHHPPLESGSLIVGCNGVSGATSNGGGMNCKLRLRFPNGKRDVITMKSTDTLQDLGRFIASKDFDLKFYEFLTNFPRKKLSSMKETVTLSEAGLCPQETIFIQEKI
uniref:UBX domain-containing protein n=1 Tax=Ciona savignyi TaxID=51511 RepID=H2YPX6_CIOSA